MRWTAALFYGEECPIYLILRGPMGSHIPKGYPVPAMRWAVESCIERVQGD